MSTYTYQQLTNSDKADVLRSKIKNNEYMLYDISASIEIEKASSDINEDLINQLEINLNNVTNKLKLINDLISQLESEDLV